MQSAEVEQKTVPQKWSRNRKCPIANRSRAVRNVMQIIMLSEIKD